MWVRALCVVFVGLAAGGACGSFAGVVSARGWGGALQGRSHCDMCGSHLRWFELVPLVSFLALRGHCRTCGMPVGWGVYIWEVGGATLGVALALPVVMVAIC